MHSPLVSVIIPVYNADGYLTACIESAMSQTWPGIEIIIIDDGSTDNSLSIAKSYEGSNIKVISQPNGGASKARNRGLEEASGAYIQFLDADDILSNDKIEAQVKALINSPGKVAVCSTVHFRNGDNFSSNAPSPYEESFLINAAPAQFLVNLWGGYSQNGSMVQPNAWLTPKKVIEKAGGWNEDLTVDDDGEFFCRVILSSEGIIKTGGYNYYRKHASDENLSASRSAPHLLSMLNASISKKNHLLNIKHSFEARLAVYKMFINIQKIAYLEFPDIYEMAVRETPSIKSNYRPAIGGRLSELLSAVFGWRMIKFVQLLFK